MDHLYTISAIEKDNAIAGGFHDEGIACYVYDSQSAGTLPFYRFYRGNHLYTLSASERPAGWNPEGICCYAYPFNPGDLIPLTLDVPYQNLYIELRSPAFNNPGSLPSSPPTLRRFAFDTGSWALCVHTSLIRDRSKITVLRSNIPGPWDGRRANLVQSQFTAMSENGNTAYTVDNFVFFEIIEPTIAITDITCGAFFGKNPDPVYPATPVESLSYKLALQKTPSGGGIFSIPKGQGWLGSDSSPKFYAGFGEVYTVSNNDILWRTNLPKQSTYFSPQYVPGFELEITFLDSNYSPSSPQASIKYSNLKATLDTFAPDMTIKFPDDAQLNPAYSRYFTKDNVPAAWPDAYNLKPGHLVTVRFAEEGGSRIGQYSFISTNAPHTRGSLT